MAQKTTKRPPVRRPAARKGGGSTMFYVAVAIVVVLGIAAVVVAKSINSGEAAEAHTNDAGASCLPEVQAPDNGAQHVQPGGDVTYNEDPPLSGAHDPNPAAWGVYDEPLRDENVVHALEHGDIAIYWNPDKPELADKLAAFAETSEFENDVLVMPRAGLRADVVATAWAVSMDCTGYAGANLDAFVTAHHDAGPEGITD